MYSGSLEIVIPHIWWVCHVLVNTQAIRFVSWRFLRITGLRNRTRVHYQPNKDLSPTFPHEKHSQLILSNDQHMRYVWVHNWLLLIVVTGKTRICPDNSCIPSVCGRRLAQWLLTGLKMKLPIPQNVEKESLWLLHDVPVNVPIWKCLSSLHK